MKVNVKGLVFVGFAAAILSGAAAHAAAGDQNIVTSKAFTDATYQAKSEELSIGNGSGEWTAVDDEVSANAESVPTTAAVKSYVDTAVQNVSNTVTGDYQTKIGGTEGQVVTSTGTAGNVTFTSVTSTATQNSGDLITSGGVYTEQQLDEKVANKLDGTTNNGIADTDNTNDTKKYPSARAVKDYVAGQLAAQNALDDTEYQAKVQGANPMLGANGAWKQLNSTSTVEVYSGTFDGKEGFGVKIPDAALADQNIEITSLTAESDAADKAKLTTAYAVKQAIDAQANQTTTDLSGKQDNLGGTVNNESTAGKVVTATATAGEVTYTGIDSQVTDNSNNLITSNAVADYVADQLSDGNTPGSGYQHTSTANYQIGNSSGTWDTMGNGTYTTWARDANTGAVTVDVNAQTSGAAIATGGATIPTSGAVADYVASQITAATNGNVIPQQNTTTVCGVLAPCALVSESTGLHWRTMATGTHGGGTCGDATGNCGEQ